MESIHTGKPMICMPFTAELPLDCARVEHLNLGTEKTDFGVDYCSLFQRLLELTFAKQSSIFADYAKANLNGIESAVTTLELIAQHGDFVLLPEDFGHSIPIRFDWDILAMQLACAFATGVLITYCCSCRSHSKPKIKT